MLNGYTEVEQTCCLNIITVWTTTGLHESTIGSPEVVGGFWMLDEGVKIGSPSRVSLCFVPSIVVRFRLMHARLNPYYRIDFTVKDLERKQYYHNRVLVVYWTGLYNGRY
jgi:hypothetical protein